MKKKAGEKLVFIIIIVVFVFSSMLVYSSFSLKAPPVVNNNSDENKKNAKIAESLATKGLSIDQKLTGVVHELEPGTYSEGTHFIEANSITLAVLEAGDKSINLDKYINKNVNDWGDSRMIAEGDGAIMSVKKVEIAN